MKVQLYAYAPTPDGALEIEDRIVARCALINSELRKLLGDIAEFDRREAWRADGAHSMEHWLQMRAATSHRTAKDWVEAAHALDSLPKIGDALEEGELSWDQVRPLSSFATPEEDAHLAREAPGWSPAALQDEARRRKGVSRQDAATAHANRFVKHRWDRDSGMLRLWGLLPADQGAVVEKTIDLVARQARESGATDSLAALRADAVTELCSSWIGEKKDSDRACVVVHVEAKELSAVDGLGELENGIALSAETVRRLACNGHVQMVAWSEDGKPIGIGRKSRTVPAWLERLVEQRDKGCRFPECGRTTWTDVHHIVPWSCGGRTDLNNLCQLCGYHHTMVHEHGMRIEGDPSGELTFIRPGVARASHKCRPP